MENIHIGHRLHLFGVFHFYIYLNPRGVQINSVNKILVPLLKINLLLSDRSSIFSVGEMKMICLIIVINKLLGSKFHLFLLTF